MPTIFLSPSTQEYNQYVTGAGSEEYFMNLLADAMEPLLLSNGIQFTRNDPRAPERHSAGRALRPFIQKKRCVFGCTVLDSFVSKGVLLWKK